MLIGELSQQTDVSTSTIRRLEKNGLITAERDHNGWRVYGPRAVETLRQLYRRSAEDGTR